MLGLVFWVLGLGSGILGLRFRETFKLEGRD